MKDEPLPSMKFTMKDFERWAKHCGHYREAAAIERFRHYCNSCSNKEQKRKISQEGL